MKEYSKEILVKKTKKKAKTGEKLDQEITEFWNLLDKIILKVVPWFLLFAVSYVLGQIILGSILS